MAPQVSEVVIVGGSLAGLFAAIVLKTLPSVTKITILERYRRQDLQDQGAGIRCNAEATDAIHEYMKNVSLKDYAFSLSNFRVLAKPGIVLDQPTLLVSTTWGQLYRVFREAVDADDKCEYRHGCAVEDVIERDGGKIQVDFEDEAGKKKLLADLVIAADGASSKVRSVLDDSTVTRTSAGYVAYRGVVPLKELSADAQKIFEQAAVFAWPPHSQLVAYVVPGNEGAADQAEPCTNWVWYRNKTVDELQLLMTDKTGKQHNFSLPHGTMKPEEIVKIKAEADDELSTVLSEVIQKTSEPFVQVVTDSMAMKTCFHDGRVLLVGDAVGGQRPHTASATMQGTYHALLVRQYLESKIDAATWERESQKLSRLLVEGGQELGQILMLSELPGQERVQAFMKVMIGVQSQLNTIWKETVQIGSSEAWTVGENRSETNGVSA